jgi:replicative DNA helicase
MMSEGEAPLARVIDRVDRISDGHVDATRVPSGFPSVDREIGGGFRRGDLVVLGGDDGAGTSSLALAMAIRRDSPALLLTTEMHPDRVHERALASSARVTIDALRLGSIDEGERVRLAAASLALRAQTPIVASLGVDGLATAARAIEEHRGVGLVIVDGVEGLLAQDTGREDALAFAVLALKRLALTYDVAIVLLSHLPQLDRTRQDRRPRLADFGARGAVGVHADLVLGLYREELYESDLGLSGATELLILKRRDGARGYADLYFFAQWLRFEDVLDPER